MSDSYWDSESWQEAVRKYREENAEKAAAHEKLAEENLRLPSEISLSESGLRTTGPN